MLLAFCCKHVLCRCVQNALLKDAVSVTQYTKGKRMLTSPWLCLLTRISASRQWKTMIKKRVFLNKIPIRQFTGQCRISCLVICRYEINTSFQILCQLSCDSLFFHSTQQNRDDAVLTLWNLFDKQTKNLALTGVSLIINRLSWLEGEKHFVRQNERRKNYVKFKRSMP